MTLERKATGRPGALSGEESRDHGDRRIRAAPAMNEPWKQHGDLRSGDLTAMETTDNLINTLWLGLSMSQTGASWCRLRLSRLRALPVERPQTVVVTAGTATSRHERVGRPGSSACGPRGDPGYQGETRPETARDQDYQRKP